MAIWQMFHMMSQLPWSVRMVDGLPHQTVKVVELASTKHIFYFVVYLPECKLHPQTQTLNSKFYNSVCNSTSDAGLSPNSKFLRESSYQTWVILILLDIVCTSPANQELLVIVMNYIICISFFHQECNLITWSIFLPTRSVTSHSRPVAKGGSTGSFEPPSRLSKTVKP